MASEYLKWKFRDVKPDEPPPPMTRKQRMANWFYYNKWWLLVGLVLLSIIGSIVWNALGIGKTKPDYIFAYIGSKDLPQTCAEALEGELASLGQDVNGDGKVAVELRQYITNRSGDPETALYYNYADETVLLADITRAESYFFLVEDAAKVQKAFQIFAMADGTPPADEDLSVEDKVYQWQDCPVLSGLETDQTLLKDLYIGRRYFVDDQRAQEQEAAALLWDILTKGAQQE